MTATLGGFVIPSNMYELVDENIVTKTTVRVRGFSFLCILAGRANLAASSVDKVLRLGCRFGCLAYLMLTSAMQGLACKYWIPEREGEGSRGEIGRFHGDI
jgi:hypothetical protein